MLTWLEDLSVQGRKTDPELSKGVLFGGSEILRLLLELKRWR